MALTLGGPVMPEYEVNDCLDALKAASDGLDLVDGVYGYRTAKAELGRAAVVTAISDVLGATPGGLRKAYDYIIDVLIRIDGDYETAERSLNAACSGIWRAIWGPNEPLWSDCYPYAPTQKPASSPDLVNFRRGLLYVRVIPN